VSVFTHTLLSGAAALDRAVDPDGAFEHALAERRRLRRRPRHPGGMEPRRLHEDVSGGGKQEPELIAEEAGAAQAVDGPALLEFLDPVLDVRALRPT
jgi:hypothetical protein